MTDPIELALPFVRVERRDRFKSLYGTKDRNRKIGEKWGTFIAASDFLDPALCEPIPPSRQTPAALAEDLATRSGHIDCVLISENPAWDGRRLAIIDALTNIVGGGFGTLLVCSDEEHAYYEGEAPGDRLLIKLSR